MVGEGDPYDENENDGSHLEEEEYDEGHYEDEVGYEEDRDDERHPRPLSSLDRKLCTKLDDEFDKLDYEDLIEDAPTRFKYRSVPKNEGPLDGDLVGAG